MGPTYLAWALTLLGDASTVDLASGAEVTVRGGSMAVVSNEAPQLAMEYSVTTMSGIRVTSSRSTLTLRYRPVTYYQIPNIADARRPLYLHQLNGGYSTLLTRRLSLDWSGDARVGDVTYASLARTFEEGTSAAAAARLPLLFLSTSANASYATGSRNTVRVGSGVNYRSVLNTLVDSESAQIPEALNVGMTVADRVTLSRQDQLEVAVGATYSQVETIAQQQGGDAVFGTAVANFSHRHSARSDSVFSGGVGASRSVDSGPTNLFPVVATTHTNRFRWGGDAFNSSVSGGVRGFVDPIFATIVPQAFLAWGLSGQHSRSFSTQAGLSAWTSVTSVPVDPAQYESSGSLAFGGTYAIDRGLSLRAGVLWQVRAPHLAQIEALTIQSQPTAFVSLRGTIGTDKFQGSWL